MNMADSEIALIKLRSAVFRDIQGSLAGPAKSL
jgi:hypothetical protein